MVLVKCVLISKGMRPFVRPRQRHGANFTLHKKANHMVYVTMFVMFLQ